MSKKILTIDFDIIMYPCLQIYNDHVAGNMNATETWNQLKQERGVEPFIHYDARTLLELGKIIHHHVMQGTSLTVCNEHQEVVDILKKSETYEQDTFSITNVDFHHDIWYRPEDKTILTNFADYNCSNWLGYLILNQKTDEVIWYKAYNSHIFRDAEYHQEIFKSIHRLDELDNLMEESFDEIYFVLSPQWVPYEFHHLFNLIVALSNNGDEIS